MWQKITDGIQRMLSEYPDTFKDGYICGLTVALAVIAALLLLRIVIAWIFRERRCKGIEVKEADGDLFVSSDAVGEVINSLQKEFEFIHIDKLYLYTRGRRHKVLLHVTFNTDGGGMPEQFARLKQRIKGAMEDVFGITSISKISVHCRKVSITRSIAQHSAKQDYELFKDEAPAPLKVKFNAMDKVAETLPEAELDKK